MVLDPPYELDAGLTLGVAIAGEGAFFRAYRTHDVVRPGALARGLTDDVTRDMVLGKELFLEEKVEDMLLGIGVDTVDGLPTETCWVGDPLVTGAYERSYYHESAESSDEEGRIRSRTGYHRTRFEVFLRAEGGQQGQGQGGAGGEAATMAAASHTDRLGIMRFGLPPLIVPRMRGLVEVESDSESYQSDGSDF